jgi:uncharacterized protein RhaS with RHS repeats
VLVWFSYDPLGRRLTYVYDGGGRLLRVTEESAACDRGVGRVSIRSVTTFEYDAGDGPG